jgi:hypothetical protein
MYLKYPTTMKNLFIAFLAATLLCSFSLSGQEKVKLEYKLEKGKEYRYKSVNAYESVQEMMGNEMKVNGEGRTVTLYQPEETNNEGVITCIIKQEDSEVHSVGMGMDTTMKVTDAIGKRFRVQIGKNGDILKEEALDTGKVRGKALTMKLLGHLSLRKLPESPVSKGEKWTKNKVDTTSMGEDGQTITTASTEYVFEGIELKNGHNCARISFKGTFELTGKIKQMGMDLFTEGNGETNGSFWVDVEKGVFISEESKTTQDITMAITGQTQMTIPSSQTITTKTILIE